MELKKAQDREQALTVQLQTVTSQLDSLTEKLRITQKTDREEIDRLTARIGEMTAAHKEEIDSLSLAKGTGDASKPKTTLEYPLCCYRVRYCETIEPP